MRGCVLDIPALKCVCVSISSLVSVILELTSLVNGAEDVVDVVAAVEDLAHLLPRSRNHFFDDEVCTARSLAIVPLAELVEPLLAVHSCRGKH